jgi:DNA-binding MarR family transcriptional regulator
MDQTTKDSLRSLDIKSYQTMLTVNQSQQSLKRMLSVCLTKYNLNMMQWLVIGVLLDGPQKPMTIAKKIGVSSPYITITLNEINKLGFITKSTYEDDGRARIIVISPKGKILAQQIEEKLMCCIQREMGDISNEELSSFFEVSSYIAKNVRHR